MKLAKNEAKAKQHPKVELVQFENYSLCSSELPSKNNKRYSKKMCKNKCISVLIVLCGWLRRKSGWKWKVDHIDKIKIDLDIDMDTNILNVKCVTIQQDLSNIWSSIHKNVKQHWAWDKKKRCLWKKRVRVFSDLYFHVLDMFSQINDLKNYQKPYKV